jgi:hypothetical protein
VLNRRGALRLPPRSVAVVAIVAVAVAGGFAGAALDRLVLRSRGFALVLPDTGYHQLSSILRAPTDDERKILRRRLADELGLTGAQSTRVDSVLDSHASDFRQLREEIRPRVERLTGSVRADVERVLTPSQRVRYRQLLGTQADTGRDFARSPK